MILKFHRIKVYVESMLLIQEVALCKEKKLLLLLFHEIHIEIIPIKLLSDENLCNSKLPTSWMCCKIEIIIVFLNNHNLSKH